MDARGRIGREIFRILEEHPELDKSQEGRARAMAAALKVVGAECQHHHPLAWLPGLRAFQYDQATKTYRKAEDRYAATLGDIVNRKVHTDNPDGRPCVCLVCGAEGVVEIDVEEARRAPHPYLAARVKWN